MLAIRNPSTSNASESARHTSSTVRLSRPAGRDACVAMTGAGLRIYANAVDTGTVIIETAKAPGLPGPLTPSRNSRLFQRVVDRGELGVQVGTEAVHDSDDRERNAGCNQAVFDRGGAGLVLHETRNQVLHRAKLRVHS